MAYTRVTLKQLRSIPLPPEAADEGEHFKALRSTLAKFARTGDGHRVAVPGSIAELIPGNKPAALPAPATPAEPPVADPSPAADDGLEPME